MIRVGARCLANRHRKYSNSSLRHPTYGHGQSEVGAGATPMTDCDAHLPLDVKIAVEKIQNHYYGTNHDDISYANMRVA